MQPSPHAYWDAQRKEVQVIWGIGGRHRHFRLPPHPSNYDVLSVETINDNEVAIYYGHEGGRPQWVQVVGIMSGGVHQSTNWQAYLAALARRAQEEQRRSEQQERDRQRRETEAKAREQREQQRRALAVRPRREAASCRADVPARRDPPPFLAVRADIPESTSGSSFYNEGFELDDCCAAVPRQYATIYDVTPKPSRRNRTGWTWLGGVLAFVAGFLGLALSASAPSRGPLPPAEAFAVLCALLVAFFGLIGFIWPRVGGFAVLLFATIGAGLSRSSGPREAMIVAFAGGLTLWFGRRNRARGGRVRKVLRMTVLAGVTALMIAEHLPSKKHLVKNAPAVSSARSRRPHRTRRGSFSGPPAMTSRK